ncbi:MAG: hypothetical protein ACRDRX_04335 [Pseudonocardiaceae bacterium]
MSAALVTMLLLLGAIAGGCIGWVAKRDDARAYLESRERYWAGRLAGLEAELERTSSSMPLAPAPTVIQHFHMPAVPVPAYLEARPALELSAREGWAS